MAQPSDRKTFWGSVAALISALAGLTAIYLFFFPRQIPPPPPTVVYNRIINSEPVITTLSIVDADLQTEVERRMIFYILPIGKYYYNIFNITISNSDRSAHDGCVVAYQFASPHGTDGHGVLFVGSWTQWATGKGFLFGFALQPDPTSTHEFFDVSQENSWPMSWARVRVACEQPRKEVSPWHDVDLTRTRWQ